MKLLVISFAICLFMDACSNPVTKNRIGKIKSVVILGNSIVMHGSTPAIGWMNDWGMAASARDSDFVHILIREIHLVDPSVVIRYANIANFEFDFENYDFKVLDSFKGADMFIMRLSENVKDTSAMEDFISAYKNLIKYLDPLNKSVKIITDGFWIRPNVNKAIKQYAKENDYAFIHLDDLQKDSSNMAYGLFANEGVAFHPGNKGMKEIAIRIWNFIKIYFPGK